MKKLGLAFLILINTIVFGQQVPKIQKTEFSKEALAQKITNSEGKKLSINQVLQLHHGKVVIVDFWASWCKDCILALPATKDLKEKNPEIQFVYFSLDRSKTQWEKGLEKHEIAQHENYWFDEGWKNAFNNYIDLNWVPRFIVIDQTGKIAKYYAISPNDPEIQKTLDLLLKS